MALGKGIPVINGFDLNSKLPLDSRAVADTMEDMNALVTNGSVTDGQLCYCKADKKLYVLKDNVWSEVGGGGGISVIELTDKNGTIASTQLSEINANPQNFAFKYNGKILLFTKSDSTTYQYCNNTTSSSENNVMTTSTLLTITSSTGVYTIAENVHNVVANSIHPANGGDLTNIQVGSKVYSIPTDLIASANKLSLGVGSTALGNGVNLDGFTYDESTKTLKAEGSGATLPAGTKDEPFIINKTKAYAYNTGALELDFIHSVLMTGSEKDFNFVYTYNGKDLRLSITQPFNSSIDYQLAYYGPDSIRTIVHISDPDETGTIITQPNGFKNIKVPTDKTESYYLNATYDATTRTSAIKWSALKKTYNHYIVISDGTASNAIYLLVPSTNSLVCSSLPELNTLLGTTNRFIQASGVVTDTASKLPIVAINWQGSFSSSKIVTMSSEEATTKFTHVVDVVTPL